jgi:hypothetical protein
MLPLLQDVVAFSAIIRGAEWVIRAVEREGVGLIRARTIP